MEQPKHLDKQTPNGAQLNLDALYQIAPSCFTEAKGDDGEVHRVVDFNKLRLLLGDQTVEDAPEVYDFTWVGKRAALQEAAAPINKTLRPCPEESVDWEHTQNLYIEGDNLEVLKLLQNSYMGKVKMIYIDPPYNTGNDFVYHDDFHRTQREEDEAAGVINEDGERMVKNTSSNGKFHSDWCSMIYSRLMVARSLLTEDGVICIQIDDNEFCTLKKICDEVFGEDNFMTTIVVKMSEPTGMKMAHASTRIPKLKEYIIVYTKKQITINPVRIPKDKWDYEYKSIIKGINEDEIKFIKIVRDNESRTENDIKRVNEILKKATYSSLSELYKERNIKKDQDKETFNFSNSWRIFQTVSMTGGAKQLSDNSRKSLNQLFFCIVTPERKMYIIRGDYSFEIDKPRIKVLFADDYLTVNPCDFWQDIKTTGLDNEGFVDFRNGKKPMKLIERLVQLFTKDDDLIMDFFSGSGTTGHVVLDYNVKSKSHRKFIMVQLPEKVDENSEDYQDDFKYITEIGKERIRRAGKKIKEEHPEAKDLDIGFRVFKCESSNYKDVAFAPKDYDQGMLEGLLDNIKAERNDLDLLFDCMLRWGVELSMPLSSQKVDGCTIHNVNDGDLVACFDGHVTEKVIDAIAALSPVRVVFRDSSFNEAANKMNLFELFKQKCDWSDEEVRNNVRVI